MSRNLSDKKQNAKLEAIQKRYDTEDDEAMRVLMSTPNGRQVICRLARNYAWMGDGWDAASSRMTDFNAGRRSAALDFMGWAERVAADDFHLMLREAADRDRTAADLKAAAITETEQTDG